nr:hypothetical protein [uncultured Flavobacterium sp.]
MKNTILVFSFLLFSTFYLYGQKYVLKNEKIIYSFQTNKGKIMTLCSDKNGKYIIYRFGTKNNIELEYPNNKDKSSWNTFEYSYWLRGGGIENEGIDLNYVAFTIDKNKYVIYNTYFANGEKYATGIKIINLLNKNVVNITGNYKTIKGTLIDFRFDKSIKEGEELYD